jgi:hypothetical protein
MPVPTAFPHVTQVEDMQAQASLRLLWDRLHACEAALAAVTADRKKLQRQVAEIPRLKAQLALAESIANG